MQVNYSEKKLQRFLTDSNSGHCTKYIQLCLPTYSGYKSYQISFSLYSYIANSRAEAHPRELKLISPSFSQSIRRGRLKLDHDVYYRCSCLCRNQNISMITCFLDKIQQLGNMSPFLVPILFSLTDGVDQFFPQMRSGEVRLR